MFGELADFCGCWTSFSGKRVLIYLYIVVRGWGKVPMNVQQLGKEGV